MRISPQQLDGALTRGLAPVYLLFGAEPLQLGEAAAAIRAAAARQGFDERRVLEQTGDFDWSTLAGEVGSLSLFAQRRLIELRLGVEQGNDRAGEKIGRVGADAIRAHCERPPEDVLLLILAPHLEWKALKTKWVQALDRVGVIVQVREPQGAQLTKWLDGRLRRAGFVPTGEALALLAERVEGNLLAADQEITKLGLLRDPGPLDAEGLLAAVADSARYGLFDLSDAAVAGDAARVERIVQGLKAEDTPLPLVLWVLAREVRKLAAIAFAQARGQDLRGVLAAHQVFDSRRQATLAAVRRLGLKRLWALMVECAQVDQAIKGCLEQDPWRLLGAVAAGLAAPGQR
jgi:DNA polymerase-3 subunit delta